MLSGDAAIFLECGEQDRQGQLPPGPYSPKRLNAAARTRQCDA